MKIFFSKKNSNYDIIVTTKGIMFRSDLRVGERINLKIGYELKMRCENGREDYTKI